AGQGYPPLPLACPPLAPFAAVCWLANYVGVGIFGKNMLLGEGTWQQCAWGILKKHGINIGEYGRIVGQDGILYQKGI
ncbi:hypothetical protein D3Z51_06900, partial [Clostridiaceae bacterium]|nr:hypothetical protein [Clostridiaceae bacterium]